MCPTGIFGRLSAGWWFAAVLLLVLMEPAWAGKKWRVYENCQLVPSKYNDGDSFHMKYTRPGYGRRYFIRLYFVDCPETDDSVPERLKEQAEYWGVSEEAVLRVGKKAKKFTEDFLEDGFIVHSRLQDARGRSERKRYYANVRVGERYLAVELVKNGLARIHGHEELHPEGPKISTFRTRLKAAEQHAKDHKLGVWALALKNDDPFQRVDGPPRPTGPPAVGESFPSPGADEAAVRKSPRQATATAAQANGIEQQTIRAPGYVPVYSLKDDRYVGTIKPGREIQVLRAESSTMVRIRFRVTDTKIIEAQCYRYDLGL